MIRNIAVVALVAGAAFAGVPAVAAGLTDAEVIQQARDTAAIEDLMWRYARALDTLNADAYVAVYTEDGAFGATKGREALHKMVADLRKNREERVAKGERVAGTLHMTANHWIEFIGKDRARIHNYYLTAFTYPPAPAGATGAAAAPPPSRPPVAGRGVDDLVRVNGQWFIKNRDVSPKD